LPALGSVARGIKAIARFSARSARGGPANIFCAKGGADSKNALAPPTSSQRGRSAVASASGAGGVANAPSYSAAVNSSAAYS